MSNDFDSLYRKLEKLNNQELISMVSRAMSVTTSKLRSIASDNAPVNRAEHGGELRRSIYSKVSSDKDTVTGEVFSNKEYAMYVEVGTGPNGEKEHPGISPNVTPVYRTTGWMIPAYSLSMNAATVYGFPVVKRSGEIIGYLTRGQKARPFLYPAIHDNEKALKNLFSRQIEKELRRFCHD